MFQVLELVSVGCIVYFGLLDHFFGNGNRSSLAAQDKLSKVEQALIEMPDIADCIRSVKEQHAMLADVKHKLSLLMKAHAGVH